MNRRTWMWGILAGTAAAGLFGGLQAAARAATGGCCPPGCCPPGCCEGKPCGTKDGERCCPPGCCDEAAAAKPGQTGTCPCCTK
jgi:hypothetical protein